MNIDVTITVSNGWLVTLDNTVYKAEDIKYNFIEFVCYSPYELDGNPTSIKSSKIISDYTQKRSDIQLKQDGGYKYYKLSILKQSEIGLNIKDKLFTYNNEVYIGLNNVTKETDIIINSKLVTDYYELILRNDISYYCEHNVFTIHNINNCVTKLQKECLFNKECNSQMRDFLFISAIVITNLIAKGDFFEAQRIVENLESCNSLCDSKIINSNNCSCG